MQVSVIIPTYNRLHYVQEAIDSVLQQKYKDYEIIVIDDGSTDGTADILPSKYGDRIRYRWTTNQGESAARNYGIELASGKYIAFLDSDDLWLPDKLEKQMAYLDMHPDVGSVNCQGFIIDVDGNLLSQKKNMVGASIRKQDLSLDALLTNNTFGNPTMLLVRKDVLSSVGGFDSSIQYGEDWDLNIRLSAHAPIAHIRQPLCKIRYHQNNQWRSRTWDIIQPTLQDKLRIIDKGFSLVDENDNKYKVLRRHAEANQYSEAGLSALALGKYKIGSSWLTHAAEVIQEKLIDPAYLGRAYGLQIIEVQDRTRYYDANELSDVLHRLQGALKSANFDRRVRKTFMYSAISTLLIDASRRNDHDIVRFILPRLLFDSSRATFKLGVLAIGLESYLVETLTSKTRRLAKKIFRR